MLYTKSTNTQQADPASRLTRLYVIALSLVALLSLAGHGLVHLALQGMDKDSRVINLAGRQRMLSQKLAKAALLESPEGREEMARVLPLLEETHRGLLRGNFKLGLPGDNSPQLRSLFLPLQTPYKHLTESAQALLLNPAASDQKRRLLEAEPRFLLAMERIVAEYELESAERVRFLQNLDLLLLGLTLLVLVQEGLLIFRPGVHQIRLAFEQLDLARRDLTLRNQELQLAVQLKGQFIGNVSHEIRTPLQGLLGTSGLLLHSQLSRQQRNLVESLNASAEALTLVLNDILDFAKMEKGELCLRPVPADLLLCIEEAMEVFAADARQRGLDFILRYPAEVPRNFVFDPGRLRQVLINLLSNAMKFTHSGHVLVEVCGRPDGSQLEIVVEDTGSGIPGEFHQRIFERFFQVDAGWSRHYGGTGLGLAICQELVSFMAGQLSVDSKPDEGSRFRLRLPLTRSGDPVAGPLNQVENLRGRRILVVDDHAINRLIFQEQLTAWGLDCVTAHDAQVGLAQFELAQQNDREFDLVLIDQMMPGCDGLWLARQLNRIKLSAVLVLASSSSELLPASVLEECGLQTVLCKPIRESELLLFLRQLGGTRSAKGRRRHILLVDDGWFDLQLARSVFERLGARVNCALRQSLRDESIVQGDYDLIVSLGRCLTPSESSPFQGVPCESLTVPVQFEKVQELLQSESLYRVNPFAVDLKQLECHWALLEGHSSHEIFELMEEFSRATGEAMLHIRTLLRKGEHQALVRKSRSLLPMLQRFGAVAAFESCQKLVISREADLPQFVDQLAHELCRYQSQIDRLWWSEA